MSQYLLSFYEDRIFNRKTLFWRSHRVTLELQTELQDVNELMQFTSLCWITSLLPLLFFLTLVPYRQTISSKQ